MALRQFQDIPAERPRTPLLDRISTPDDVRALSRRQLPDLANELRAFLLYTVGQTGGHFGAGLGVIELTIALHYCFQTPEDRLVWDVGHQTYPHKILTGRREQMRSLRQKDGIAAFPKRDESPFDTFGVGHSSTSISAALGMALVAKQKGEKRRNIAVIGDGAMTAGMAFEALNHAAQEKANLLVILNDNDMSISGSTGGLSRYLTRVLTSELYTSVRESGKRLLHGLPRTRELVRKTEEYAKGMITPTASTFFEELGFNYIGPVNGHDLPSLVQTLEAMKDFEGPWFLHVLTQKGKGFTPAEADPIGYHAIGKHSSVKSPANSPAAPANSPAAPAKKPTYSNVFGQWLCDMAKADARLNGITPAMREGSDMVRFSKAFPDRFHDVAIAEQHAVTLAAGMACEGYKPVVAIYSTFLQRGYDQLIHDVALQDLDVLFAIDRAGLVGEDGPTHAGAYDLSFLRCIPNMVVMAPSDEAETRLLLNTGYHHHGPAAVRYPRGTGPGVPAGDSLDTIPLGRARILREGQGLAILAFGSLTTPARQVAEILDATLVDMRFVKPLDEALVLDMATRHLQLVTLEENSLAGGAGAAVLELLARARIQTPVHCLGLPDRVIEHGKPDELLSACGLDAAGIEKSIRTHCDLNEVINIEHVSLQAP